MGGRDYLGEFELVVLLALARMEEGGYGASIHGEILGATGRDVSIPAVYVTLKRLDAKGLVESFLGASSRVRRKTRNYRVTSAGHEAIERSRRQLERLWEPLPPTPREAGS